MKPSRDIKPYEFQLEPRLIGDFGHIDVYLLARENNVPRVPEVTGYFTLQFVEVDSNEEHRPAITMSPRNLQPLQRLMDDLWALNIRPSNNEGNVGALSATQAHLKDLQGIVGKTLEKAINPPIVNVNTGMCYPIKCPHCNMPVRPEVDHV